MNQRIKAATATKNKFKQLLDQYDYVRPKKGDFMEAEILQIDDNRILVDLGLKTDAVVTANELKKTDDEIIEDLNIGDFVPVYILNPPTMMRKPAVSLQRGLEKQDWDKAGELLHDKSLLRATVSGKNKGGLLIKFGKLEGFLPSSLLPTVSRAPNRKAAEIIKMNLIGEELVLQIIEVNKYRKRLIFSAREDSDGIEKHVMDEIFESQIRTGIVVNLVEYGAFIDLLGVDGLLHTSEMAEEEPEDPNEILNLGDKIEVKILNINEDNKRISLSLKGLSESVNEFSALASINGQ